MKRLKRLKKGLAFLIAAVLLLSVFPIMPKTVWAADVVNIPDEALRTAIANALGVSENADITSDQLGTLTRLNVTGKVSDLTGIESCTQLGNLTLRLPSDNALDLTPLKDLSMLKDLSLYTGKVSSFPQTQSITSLSLSNCEVLDPASIANLTGLERLDCNQTTIAKLPDCSGMNSLKTLMVMNTPSLTDISGISGCTSLNAVFLSRCSGLTDLSPLSGLSLKTLELEYVEITSENQTSYMNAIATLSNLQSLNLYYTGLEDQHVSMFDNLNSLEQLIVSENKLTDANFLVSHKNSLKKVALNGNPISDSTPLGELTNLEAMEISQTQITDFSFLSKLSDLKSGFVKGTEWTTDSPAKPKQSITDSYQAGTEDYTLQNPFKGADGKRIAPEVSDKYSYNEGTGEITVSIGKVSTWPLSINFPYTYTAANGEQLEAEPYISLSLTRTTPLTITKQPVGVDIEEGENATLRVTASGSGTLSYQWYKGSEAISGATSSSYKISNAGLSDAGSYKVVVTDKNGSVTSNPAEVKVTAIPLTITKQPAGVNITEGKNATLSVTASGSGTLSYQWYKDNNAISGATSSSYTISNAGLSDAGSYTVKVTDKNGNVTSDPAVVKVTAIPLEITAQPQNVNLTEGDSTTLTVTASGSGTLSYQWYKGSDAISGATSSSYTISNAALSDTGSYKVVVTDKNGSVTSDPAEVRVTVTPIPLTITKQPAGVNITEGENATLSVTASGNGTLTYQWYKGSNAISGATSSSYTISNAGLSDAGGYKVKVTDKNGSVDSDPAEVKVTAIPLTITAQPQNVNLTEGDSATLSVTASGSGPLSYQWYKGSDAISGATSSSYTISNAGLSDAGSYTVKVTDKNGSITSDPAEVRVTVTPIPLTITKQPAGVDIEEGGNTTLSVTASGSGTLTYQWYKGSDTISGATSSSYTISNAALNDAGSYKVVVTDQNGSITSDSAVVRVTAIPLEITAQPQNVNLTEGDSATLTVMASGSGPLTYQWYKDSNAISGAISSSYTISNAGLSDAGSYTVKVTDKNGSITSDPAEVRVTVTPIPLTITKQPVGVSITEGENATLSVTASGNGTLTYQWYKGSEAISGATSSSYTISNAALSAAGSYKVVVTDQNGSITSNSAVVTVKEKETTETEPTGGASEEYEEEEEDETGAVVAAVKTADTSPIVPVMVLLLVSGMVMCVTVSDKKNDFIQK